MKQCESCGNHVKRKDSKYCSRQCSYTGRTKTIVITCEFCSKDVTLPAHRGIVKFCGKDCYRKHLASLSENKIEKTCCDCGEIKQIGQFPRKNSRTVLTSSYCYDCRRIRGLKKSHTSHDRFVRSKRAACKKNGESWWQLTESDFTKMINDCCHYCGGRTGISGSSLDRKDNSYGYTLDNVVPCCGVCNVVKNSHFTYLEMMELSPSLRKIRINRESFE